MVGRLREPYTSSSASQTFEWTSSRTLRGGQKLKKLMTLATLLVVLLVAYTPLVLAQQDASQTTPMKTAPAPPAPSIQLTLEDPFSFDASNNLVLDCNAVFRNLALLDHYRGTTQESDPQFQADLADTENLSRTCVNNGLASFGQASRGSEGAGTEQYQG